MMSTQEKGSSPDNVSGFPDTWAVQHASLSSSRLGGSQHGHRITYDGIFQTMQLVKNHRDLLSIEKWNVDDAGIRPFSGVSE